MEAVARTRFIRISPQKLRLVCNLVAGKRVEQALSILQQLSAADPTNVVYLRNIGLCYETSAQALSNLAGDETRSKIQRIKDWIEARSWFAKALGLFSELHNRGTLMPADSGQTAKLTAKIRECDTAIARLTN